VLHFFLEIQPKLLSEFWLENSNYWKLRIYDNWLSFEEKAFVVFLVSRTLSLSSHHCATICYIVPCEERLFLFLKEEALSQVSAPASFS